MRLTIRLLAGFAAFGTAGLAAADQALVVGINSYPGFSPNEQLRGAVADANAIARRLTANGFQVTLVTDARATEAGIKAAFGEVARKSTARDRFVFFFAGHGWRNSTIKDHAALVPHDATKSALSTPEITSQELAGLLRSVPANTRSAILDSCFSGAMSGSRSFGDTARSLEHPASGSRMVFPTDGTRDLVKVAAKVATDGGSVYYAASGPEQLAYERPVNGQARGLFSLHLEQVMGSQPRLWGDAARGINDNVTMISRSLQTPMLFPATANSLPFLGARGQNPPTPPPTPQVTLSSLWDQFSASAPDPRALNIFADPQRTTFRVGEQLRLRVQSGQAGYVVVLNRGTSGAYYIQHPEDLSGTPQAVAARARIAAGGRVEIPEAGFSFEPDKAGTEELRAILYTSEAEFLKVAALLQEATKSSRGSNEFTAEGARDLRKRPTRVDPGRTFFTASLQLTIEPGSFFAALAPQEPAAPFRRGLGWSLSKAEDVNRADKAVLRQSRQAIPSSVILTDFLPPVGDQGSQGSCVAWAIGYYAYGYGLNQGRKLQAARRSEPQFLVSPSFIYNQINGGRDEGSFIFAAARLLKEKGAASKAEMPYNEADFRTQPGPEAVKMAGLDRATEVYLIGSNTRFVPSEVKQFIAEMRLPVVFGKTVHESFMDMPKTPGFVYRGPTGPNDRSFGGHAMCVVGYDDQRQAFRVVNSWGTGWGDNGFVWISYDLMAQAARDDWAVIPGGIQSRSLSTARSFRVVRGRS